MIKSKRLVLFIIVKLVQKLKFKRIFNFQNFKSVGLALFLLTTSIFLFSSCSNDPSIEKDQSSTTTDNGSNSNGSGGNGIGDGSGSGSSTITGASAFSFPSQDNLPLNSSITSGSISLEGFSGLMLSKCNGCTGIYLNGVLNGNSAVVSAGDYVAMEITTSILPNTSKQAVLYVGTTAGTFTATTSSNTPDPFSFTNQTGAFTSATITSSTVTLSGSFSNATATCGTGCTKISINGATFVSGPVSGVNSGDTIAIQLTSSSQSNTSTTAVVTVGGTTSTTWTVTTTNDPCANVNPTVGQVCADGSVYAGLSPDGNVPMFVTKCDAGLDNAAGACLDHATNTGVKKKWSSVAGLSGIINKVTGRQNTEDMHTLNGSANHGTFEAGEYCRNLILHGHDDWYLPAEDELNVIYTGHVAIANFIEGAGEWYWSSTDNPPGNGGRCLSFNDGTQSVVTKDVPYWFRCARIGSSSTTTPNEFSFTNQSGAYVGAVITSSTVTLNGTFANVAASCGVGCSKISINNAPYVAGPVYNINPGDTISIQMNSATTSLTSKTATVYVGGRTSAVWQVTTLNDPCANANPTVGQDCADGSVYAGLSPDGNVPMFVTKCDAGLDNGTGSCLDHATNTGVKKKWESLGLFSTGIQNKMMGRKNTEDMYALIGNSNYGTFEAGMYCRNLILHGHDDWYLPAQDELNVIYNGYVAIENFINTAGEWYWSSSETTNSSGSEAQQFYDGTQSGKGANIGYWVRCARRN